MFVGLVLQFPSLHQMFTYESSKRCFKNLLRGRIPKTDAVVEVLAQLDVQELTAIHDSIVRKIRTNKTFREGTINKLVVVAIDGVELFSSQHKSCKNCLTRQLANGTTEYFHRSVVCASVGSHPHVILGQEMLFPRDSSQKDEGELTGAKRLIERLYKAHHHFADVVVADALYLNEPFIATLQKYHIHFVIRMKDERRLIFQDAYGLFRHIPCTHHYQDGKTDVRIWDAAHFELGEHPQNIRVLKVEERMPNGEVKTMWLASDLLSEDAQTLRTIMHKRWDIELNAFHQLKTYYHVDHCFCHRAVEAMFLLNIFAFNMREMFIYRRCSSMKKDTMALRDITLCMFQSLTTDDLRHCFDSS